MKEMAILLIHILVIIVKLLKPGGAKIIIAENLAMRQQLIIMRRKSKMTKAPPLTPFKRVFFGLLVYFVPENRIRQISIILSPVTIFKLHNILKRKKYYKLFSSHKTSRKPGPKGPSKEIIDAVVQMKQKNIRIGCPKIALFISNTFGVQIDKDIVRRILAKYYHPNPFDTPGPSWLTFIGHMKDALWSLDLFRVESINLQTHWVMVVMDQYTRRIIGFSVINSNSLNGSDVCRMLNSVINKRVLPKYISSDNDPLFRYFLWKANLRIFEIEEIKSVPYTPIAHPFIERLIGTLRAEYLDHIPFIGPHDLWCKLDKYKNYYNEYRVHSSLSSTPSQLSEETKIKTTDFNNYRWESHCRGLFQTPMAA